MADVKVYLSHGGGVNSWALYLWLIEQGEKPEEDFEAVFVNHGTDWPETYEYMDMMIAKGYPVTVIQPDAQGFDNLYDYCFEGAVDIPNRLLRWCTDKFKIRPQKLYQQKPCVAMVGYDAGEPDRVNARFGSGGGVEYRFPLVEEGINRQGCIEIIQSNGLPVPPKSGCYICPFQKRSQWIELRERHPELFCKAQKLEQVCNQRRASQGKDPLYFKDRPLEQLIQVKDSRGRLAVAGQLDMFDDHDRPPCRCGL